MSEIEVKKLRESIKKTPKPGQIDGIIGKLALNSKTFTKKKARKSLDSTKNLSKNKIKPGTFHTELAKTLNEFSEAKKTKFREKLKSSSIKSIRFGRIFEKDDKKKPAKERIVSAKLETEKRLAAYTSHFDKEWYTLDYKSVHEDHEMGIGLGNILIDPTITKVQIEQNGQYFTGIRKSKNKRIGFYDERTDKYLATFTGDKFKILTEKPEKEDANYRSYFIKQLNTENNTREESKKYLAAQTLKHGSISSADKRELAKLELYSANAFENTNLLKEENTNKETINAAQKECTKNASIKSYESLKRKRPSCYKLINTVCKHFGIPRSLLYATFKHESSFNQGAWGDRDIDSKGSKGMGQFRPDTWDRISKRAEFTNFMGKYYPGKTFTRSENILASMAASAVLLKKIANEQNIDLQKPLSIADTVCIRAGYNAGEGKAKWYKNLYINGVNNKYVKEYVKFAVSSKQYEIRKTPETTSIV